MGPVRQGALSNVKQKRVVLRAMVGKVGMRHRLKQTLSDVGSSKKRSARDCLFESFGIREAA